MIVMAHKGMRFLSIHGVCSGIFHTWPYYYYEYVWLCIYCSDFIGFGTAGQNFTYVNFHARKHLSSFADVSL